VDQRGIRTIAKVGGLVGKTISIDENTRYNPDYVRVKIACREIAEVPESAEGNLGMFIFDFFYEREET
jgi:preprotein translocase subunit YajC